MAKIILPKDVETVLTRNIGGNRDIYLDYSKTTNMYYVSVDESVRGSYSSQIDALYKFNNIK